MNFQVLIRERIKGLTGPQLICCSIAAMWLTASFLNDLLQSIFSALLKDTSIGILALSIPITLAGVVLPLVSVLWLYPQVVEHRSDVEKRWPRYLTIVTVLLGYGGLFLLVGVLATFSIVADLWFPFSVVPLTTTVCGVIWVCIGRRMLRNFNLSRGGRLTVLALCLCLILSVKFMDWNKRKSFVRDLYRIKAGSTVEQVETTMSGYLRGTGISDPRDQDQEFMVKDSMVFRHSTGVSYGADWGIVEYRDGKVVRVDFSPD